MNVSPIPYYPTAAVSESVTELGRICSRVERAQTEIRLLIQKHETKELKLYLMKILSTVLAIASEENRGRRDAGRRRMHGTRRTGAELF